MKPWLDGTRRECMLSFKLCIWSLHRLGAFKQKPLVLCRRQKNPNFGHIGAKREFMQLIENARFPKVKGNTSLPEGAWNSRFKAIEWLIEFLPSTWSQKSLCLLRLVMAADKKSASRKTIRNGWLWEFWKFEKKSAEKDSKIFYENSRSSRAWQASGNGRSVWRRSWWEDHQLNHEPLRGRRCGATNWCIFLHLKTYRAWAKITGYN